MATEETNSATTVTTISASRLDTMLDAAHEAAAMQHLIARLVDSVYTTDPSIFRRQADVVVQKLGDAISIVMSGLGDDLEDDEALRQRCGHRPATQAARG
jgi:uncharacterized protein (DUF849 family)